MADKTKGLYRVELRCRIDIEADDGVAAEEAAFDELSTFGGDVDVDDIKVLREPPYVRPQGTDRWAVVADEIRFADKDDMFIVGEATPGSWWWSNGHVALLCEGDRPNVEKVASRLDMAAVLAFHLPRRPVKLRPPRTHSEYSSKIVRAIEGVADYVVQDRYVRLVEAGCPNGVTWLAGSNMSVPLHALSGGQVVAAVMGLRS